MFHKKHCGYSAAMRHFFQSGPHSVLPGVPLLLPTFEIGGLSSRFLLGNRLKSRPFPVSNCGGKGYRGPESRPVHTQHTSPMEVSWAFGDPTTPNPRAQCEPLSSFPPPIPKSPSAALPRAASSSQPSHRSVAVVRRSLVPNPPRLCRRCRPHVWSVYIQRM